MPLAWQICLFADILPTLNSEDLGSSGSTLFTKIKTEIHHNLENSTCEPLNYTMGSPTLIVSICMGNPIRIQRVNYHGINIVTYFYPNKCDVNAQWNSL